MTEDQPKRVYEIKTIYLKDASFESPMVPEYFNEPPKSSGIDVDVNVQHRILDDQSTLFECVLMLRITAKDGDKVIFMVDVTQSGIAQISGFSDSDLEKLLNIAVPNSLLPFARETIASLVSKGGFPQLLLRPINFERIYAEKLKADQQNHTQQEVEH